MRLVRFSGSLVNPVRIKCLFQMNIYNSLHDKQIIEPNCWRSICKIEGKLKKKQYIIELRRITYENTHLINSELISMDWNSILQHNSAQDSFARFHETWILIQIEYFPEIRGRISNRKSRILMTMKSKYSKQDKIYFQP